MITFDHAFNYIHSVREYSDIETLGFNIDIDNVVNHPGKRQCRFLKFKNERYLEFIHCTDLNEFLKLENNILNEDNLPIPGLSGKTISTNLRDLKSHYINTFSSWGAYFIHQNYDWEQDSSKDLPGWNFLLLRSQMIKNIYLWITEYEHDPNWSKKDFNPHPNGLNEIIGAAIIFQSESEKNSFTEFFMLNDSDNILYSSNSDFKIYYEIRVLRRLEVGLKAIILKIDSQKKLQAYIPNKEIKFSNKKFNQIIEFNENRWDVWGCI